MTKDNDWKEIEACFIRGRDDGKEYGVPTIVVNPDTLRVGIQTLLDRQREDIAREVEKLNPLLRSNKTYDGNSLQSASEHYSIAAKSWNEIIRYENGFVDALSLVLARLRAPKSNHG